MLFDLQSVPGFPDFKFRVSSSISLLFSFKKQTLISAIEKQNEKSKLLPPQCSIHTEYQTSCAQENLQRDVTKQYLSRSPKHEKEQ